MVYFNRSLFDTNHYKLLFVKEHHKRYEPTCEGIENRFEQYEYCEQAYLAG